MEKKKSFTFLQIYQKFFQARVWGTKRKARLCATGLS
jgi:hypothetical protein